MKQTLLKIISFVGLMFLSALTFGQGVTTSGMNGRVTDTKGEGLPGATVVAVHNPSGSQYGTVTDVEGYFRLANMRVGGPYNLKITYVGYDKFEKSGIHLTLGQNYNLNIDLSEASTELEEVVITADPNDVFDGSKTGQQTIVDERTIQDIPTVSRAIGDYARFNPLASIGEDTDGFEISLGGQNNRYNTIYIDGAVNNDVFGLAGSGTNGGQTGVQPVSIDAIEQFQVSVAPFDVRQSGFSGGSINAVTRSGTNDVEGSAYYFWRNESLAGKTPTNDETLDREKLSEFTAKTYGARVGGPIVKDKAFFFVNFEKQDDATPQPFNFSNYNGDADLATINQIIGKLKNDYNYDPGSFDNNESFLKSDKIIAKFDFNLSQKHKLSVRHSYVNAENLEARNSSPSFIGFLNGSEYFISKTNSSAVELNSIVGNNASNKLKIGATFVRDDRDPFGSAFPTVEIADGSNGNIAFGAERFSTANLLNQDVITINNDYEWYRQKHSFLVGVNFEYFKAGNLFIRNNYGRYRFFGGTATFLTDDPVAARFERSFSQVDNVTGDESSALAEIRQYLIGAYFQDEIQVNSKFKFSVGLRFDIPQWPDDQPLNADFNNTTIPAIEAHGYDLQGAKTGSFIGTKILLSPRVGFNYDVKGDKTTQLRGGFGIFTSRIPLVWPGGAYNNYGFNIGEVAISGVAFNPDVNSQPPGNVNVNNPTPSGQIDLFAEDFKIPQVFKVDIAVDKKLPWGMVGTMEVLYTKNLNNVRYQNLNLKPSTENLTGTPDDRPIFAGLNPSFGGDPVDPTYSGIYLASNTNKGYSYNLALSLTKPFKNGLAANVSYSYGDSYSLFDGTSSQNSSQWRGYFNVEGRNYEGEAHRSVFSAGHRVIGQISYEKDYFNFGKSRISLLFNGQSGNPYTYVLGARNFEIVDDGGFDFNELMYVPANQSEIILVDTEVDDVNYTAAQQWDILNGFIENDNHLSDRRGEYVERNGSRLPFQTTLDLRFLQDFYVTLSNGKKNTLQFSVDIFNFTNLLNKDWGRVYNFSFGTYSPINFEGFEPGTNTPTYSVNPEIINGEDIYNDDIDDSGFRSSRWQMQLGLRYIFGN